MKLKLNDKAPLFKLLNQDGVQVDLAKLIGTRILLLAFYPGDFTSVCTKEMVCFRQDFSEFNNLDCLILGISCDSVEQHAEFKKTYQLPFDLLSDPKAHVAKLYGVKMPLVTKANRAIFIINKDGEISYAHVETLPIFKRSNEELLAAIQRIKPSGA
jgi:peroxiredoxin Q/BCP